MKKRTKANRNASIAAKIFAVVTCYVICLEVSRTDMDFLHKVLIAGVSSVALRLVYFKLFQWFFKESKTVIKVSPNKVNVPVKAESKRELLQIIAVCGDENGAVVK